MVPNRTNTFTYMCFGFKKLRKRMHINASLEILHGYVHVRTCAYVNVGSRKLDAFCGLKSSWGDSGFATFHGHPLSVYGVNTEM